MRTVYCVLKSGGKYNPHHVSALRRMVKENLTLDHEFKCLSDADVYERIPLTHGLPGWWSKLCVFEQPTYGPCLYLDLDLIITGNIDHLFSDHGLGIKMVEDARYPSQPNSSVMAWCSSQAHVISEFLKDPIGNVHEYNIGGYVGDQRWIMDHAEWSLYKSPRIESYRQAIQRSYADGPREDTCIVNFHGKHKPWDKDMPKWCHDYYTPEELEGMRNV